MNCDIRVVNHGFGKGLVKRVLHGCAQKQVRHRPGDRGPVLCTLITARRGTGKRKTSPESRR
jgi:hypothetical protein